MRKSKPQLAVLMVTDKVYAKQLTEAGKEQLKTFDNYEQRADKLVGILEEMVKQR